jgi:hypothetical protein
VAGAAPQKRLFVISGAAHYVFMERPGEFLVDLVQYVRPLAGGGPAGLKPASDR